MRTTEAEKKWCPMIRNSYGSNLSGDCSRGKEKLHRTDYNCITDKCMMWVRDGEVYAKPEKIVETGYCGLSRGRK